MYSFKKPGSKNSKVTQKPHRTKEMCELSLIAYHEDKIRVKKLKSSRVIRNGIGEQNRF